MIFFWIFGAKADLSFFYFQGNVITVKGTSLGAIETNFYSNEIPVMENLFKFNDEFGDEWQGISYETGKYFNEGDLVTVEYPKGKPHYSRIKGMRRSMFGPWVLFVGLFPLIGFLFIFGGLIKGKKANKFLKKGIVTKGELISKERTNVKINEQTVYKLTFKFKDTFGYEHEAIVKTHQTESLEDEKLETLMYMEENPKKAILTDSLPGSLKIDESGIITSASSGKAIAALFLPAISILGHGSYLMTLIN